MNLSELQAELRQFAAERDRQPFHTPKDLSTALMIEAAGLAEIFRWMTPEQSLLAHQDAGSKGRIAGRVADMLLHLLQMADHCDIDLAQVVESKLAGDASKQPTQPSPTRASLARAAVQGTHVLLDYENVQPTEHELRAQVPDARQVWVFHGPHQRQVEQRFASFGADVTAVPISKIGKNALDFHLSFYVGYIASRNPAASMVVVANDKGYEPMLKHAKAMGFAVRQQQHGQAKPSASKKATPVAKSGTAAKPAARKAIAKTAPTIEAAANQPGVKRAPAKKAAATPAAKVAPSKKAPAKKAAPVKQVAAEPASPPTAERAPTAAATDAARPPVPAKAGAKPARPSPDSAAAIGKLIDSLRKMGDKRPTKPASLWRSLKSFLGAGANDEAVELALARLIEDGVVKVDSVAGASYPSFGPESGATTAQD